MSQWLFTDCLGNYLFGDGLSHASWNYYLKISTRCTHKRPRGSLVRANSIPFVHFPAYVKSIKGMSRSVICDERQCKVGALNWRINYCDNSIIYFDAGALYLVRNKIYFPHSPPPSFSLLPSRSLRLFSALSVLACHIFAVSLLKDA